MKVRLLGIVAAVTFVFAAVPAWSGDGRGGRIGTTFGPMIDLGTLPGHTSSDANAINDAGVIVGTSGPDGVAWTPVPGDGAAWSIVALRRDLTGEVAGTIGVSARPNGINDAGQICGIVGARLGGVGNPRPRAVVWDDPYSAPRSLPLLPGLLGAQARGLNDHGDVVGNSGPRPLVWRDGGVEALPFLDAGDAAIVYAVNNLGQVAGSSNTTPGGPQVPVAWRPTDLGWEVVALDNYGGSSFDFARAINDAGHVVGVSGVADGVDGDGFPIALAAHPFVWEPFAPEDDATQLRPGPEAWPLAVGPTAAEWAAARLHGVANGVNERSELVGFLGVNGSLDAGLGELVNFRTAAYWRNGGQAPRLLGTLGGRISFARGINDRGQIVGFAETAIGEPHAFVIQRL